VAGNDDCQQFRIVQVVDSPVLSPDGKFLLVAIRKRIGDVTECQMIDLKSGKGVFQQPIVSDIHCKAMSPDSRHLVTIDDNSYLKLWDLTTGKTFRSQAMSPEVTKLDDLCFTSIIYSPDGRYWATTDNKGRVLLWEAASSELIWKGTRQEPATEEFATNSA